MKEFSTLSNGAFFIFGCRVYEKVSGNEAMLMNFHTWEDEKPIELGTAECKVPFASNILVKPIILL